MEKGVKRQYQACSNKEIHTHTKKKLLHPPKKVVFFNHKKTNKKKTLTNDMQLFKKYIFFYKNIQLRFSWQRLAQRDGSVPGAKPTPTDKTSLLCSRVDYD